MSEDSQVARLLAERFNRPGEHGRIVFGRMPKNSTRTTWEHWWGRTPPMKRYVTSN